MVVASVACMDAPNSACSTMRSVSELKSSYRSLGVVVVPRSFKNAAVAPWMACAACVELQREARTHCVPARTPPVRRCERLGLRAAAAVATRHHH